ncbi:response regulator transcription factor [Amnibacterium sp. CER49]|uniref:response regulator transcription factor n=1 Tax=Amnibacterium sp. CER49 TaxID=3039161 RepID=UPI002446F033|nr:response regulator transcription factor [Amnibacterium sp. CER49]MDH2442637.1 response regulator transcription factor [Amnibacterium sp. CER49]
MIRVLVADDHPIVRAGIVALLSQADDVEVVDAVTDGAAAVTAALATRPDVMLMDLRMPGLDGTAATGRITAALPDVKVVVLTTYETDDAILEAIAAGASGYLLKAAPEREILAGIRSVAAGGTVMAPAIAAALARGIRQQQTAPRLSDREREVLGRVADGRSNAEIGRDLHLAEATVKTHLLHVFEKLGVSDRTRAVTRAMELGLLPR